MPQRLIILGTSGSASDVLDIIEALNARSEESWHVAGYLDDTHPSGTRVYGLEVLGSLADAGRYSDHHFISSIGSDRTYRRRPEIVGRTGIAPDRFATLVHPLASVSARARLGRGVYVCPGGYVGGGAIVGDHATIHPGAIVGHDSTIGEHAIVAPGAVISGFVSIGRAAYVGAGAVVRQRLAVGDESLVGMGAVVTRDVAPGTTVIGCPARPIDAK